MDEIWNFCYNRLLWQHLTCLHLTTDYSISYGYCSSTLWNMTLYHVGIVPAPYDRLLHMSWFVGQNCSDRLQCLGVEGSVLSVLTKFLSYRSQYFIDIYVSMSSLIAHSMSWIVTEANWLTWCKVCLREEFGSAVVPPVHRGAFLNSGNKFYGYAGDSTMVEVPSPGERVVVRESLNHGLKKVSMWCDLCGIKSNAR